MYQRSIHHGRYRPSRRGCGQALWGITRCAPTFGVSFGAFKQSGIGREGVREGLTPLLAVKFAVLEGQPEGYENITL